MKAPQLSARIALRYLRSKKSHTAVTAISAVSVCGVAIATAAIVCVLSVFNGFRSELDGRFEILSPEIELTPASGKVFDDAGAIITAAKGIKGVEHAMASVTDNALAFYDGHELPVTLHGVEVEAFRRHSGLDSIMLAGSRPLMPAPADDIADDDAWPDEPQLQQPASAAASIGAAVQLGSPLPGDGMLVFAPKRMGRVNTANPSASFIRDSLRIDGIYQAGQSQFDDNIILTDIAVARRLFQYDTQASAIDVRLADGADAEKVTAELSRRLGKEVVVKDRARQQDINFRMVEIEKWVTFLLLFFILAIASFNIISTLTMLVLEKQRSMSVLHALGMTRRSIGGIFAWQSMLITIAGGAAGMLLGIALCLIQQEFGIIRLNGEPGTMIVEAYPVRLQASDLLATTIPILLTGGAAAAISAAFARSRLR